ncbi:MAG: FAD-binding oxidoreductase, partial [Aliifodinibius sp.]|nr:FAD-binding oxidoreductase [candidate division Zixibacteria bacterium]NIT57647.1 FAD-binding oxidoreductase [Fodinibius sp.]NIW45336.1 FAD-binding oxidoreductase [Gammaproteobacteria bacterium]NIR64463.1 FAD-binding oxidoreductase [candidate division Zixibacteria bacterium]NIS46377.1 FAD-binding oxidoreductase [candidate division Zixibacteria bacterium]
DYGYAIDTLETAVPWSEVNRTMNGIESSIRQAAQEYNEQVHIFTHLSHLYPTGSSIYTTYLFRINDDPVAALEFWRHMKTAASKTIVEHRGTISHQHGVGVD